MSVRVPLILHRGRILLIAVVHAREQRARLVRFIIDTGSNDSYLNAKDRRQLGIRLTVPKAKEMVLWSGTLCRRIPINNLTLYLWAGRNRRDQDEYERCTVQLYELRASQRKSTLLGLPSILGMNFLRDHRFALHVRPAEQLAYLERR